MAGGLARLKDRQLLQELVKAENARNAALEAKQPAKADRASARATAVLREVARRFRALNAMRNQLQKEAMALERSGDVAAARETRLADERAKWAENDLFEHLRAAYVGGYVPGPDAPDRVHSKVASTDERLTRRERFYNIEGRAPGTVVSESYEAIFKIYRQMLEGTYPDAGDRSLVGPSPINSQIAHEEKGAQAETAPTHAEKHAPVTDEEPLPSPSHQPRKNRSFRAYVRRILRNRLIDQTRKHQRRDRRELTVEDDTLLELAVDAEDEFDSRSIAKMLKNVSKENRRLLWLFYVKGAKIKEYALKHGMQRSAVDKSLSRARREFFERFLEQLGLSCNSPARLICDRSHDQGEKVERLLKKLERQPEGPSLTHVLRETLGRLVSSEAYAAANGLPREQVRKRLRAAADAFADLWFSDMGIEKRSPARILVESDEGPCSPVNMVLDSLWPDERRILRRTLHYLQPVGDDETFLLFRRALERFQSQWELARYLSELGLDFDHPARRMAEPASHRPRIVEVVLNNLDPSHALILRQFLLTRAATAALDRERLQRAADEYHLVWFELSGIDASLKLAFAAQNGESKKAKATANKLLRKQPHLREMRQCWATADEYAERQRLEGGGAEPEPETAKEIFPTRGTSCSKEGRHD